MRHFILLSIVLHGLVAGLLYEIYANRPVPLLPGNIISLTLQAFSEPADSPQVKSPTRRKTARKQPATATSNSETGAPAREHAVASTEVGSDVQQQAAEPIQSPTEKTDIQKSLRAAVYSALHASFTYPRRARLRGWEGTVVISLRIMPDGHLSDIHVADSSGIPVLDRAALRSLAQITLPQVVAWIDGQEIDMLIPVEYRLTDS